jgi:RNA recognition motif-containing protein
MNDKLEPSLPVAKKLFIGNLPYTTTNEDLGEYFAQYGEVLSAAVIMDRATGRSKGFGFVEMTNDEEADAAIAKADGAEMEGRKLTVSEARPKVEAAR